MTDDIESRERTAGQSTQPGRQTQTNLLVHQFFGPLPPPDVLAAYGRLRPDLIDFILKQAEEQSSRRHELERFSLRGGILLRLLGTVSALSIGLAGLGVSYLMVAAHEPIAGAVVGSLNLAALVSAFIQVRQKKP